MISFVIPTCIRSDIHLRQFERCLAGIKTYHPASPIHVINDSDEKISLTQTGITIHKSLMRGAAEQQTFKLISMLQNENASNRYVILHDSMILNKPLQNIETIEDIKFLWHFTNHRIHWDTILEPITEYTLIHNITSHTNFIKHCLYRDYTDHGFIQYAVNALSHKDTWCGCFGLCCIVTQEFIKKLDSFCRFTDIFLTYIDRRSRMVNESIFALLCNYYFPHNCYELSYDGLYYDGIRSPTGNGTPVGVDGLTYIRVGNFVSKISFGR
jgi:hypothetical protein